jgi:hypothetical protein
MGVNVAAGVEPTSAVAVCFGVGKERVFLRDSNKALACAEAVALTETVVTEVA